MRRTAPLHLIALTLSAATLSAAARGEDLFSEIAVESVFGAASKTEPTGSTASSIAATPDRRVTGAGQLGELLRNAGLEPQRLDGKSVKTTVKHGQWTIPTTLFAAVDRGQVDLTMGLATLPKGSKGDAAKLLRLLSVSENGGVHFAFDATKGQIQLRQTLSARGMSGTQLRRLLTEMAEFAVSRETAWYEATAPATQGVGTKTTDGSLVGSWIATLGAGEAFAIKLTADNRFNLAHVKTGKTTTSSGKVERTGDTLRLIGAGGITLTGTVANTTADGFELTLSSGKKLAFKKPAVSGS